jgi:hypothetical protein
MPDARRWLDLACNEQAAEGTQQGESPCRQQGRREGAVADHQHEPGKGGDENASGVGGEILNATNGSHL